MMNIVLDGIEQLFMITILFLCSVALSPWIKGHIGLSYSYKFYFTLRYFALLVSSVQFKERVGQSVVLLDG